MRNFGKTTRIHCDLLMGNGEAADFKFRFKVTIRKLVLAVKFVPVAFLQFLKPLNFYYVLMLLWHFRAPTLNSRFSAVAKDIKLELVR